MTDIVAEYGYNSAGESFSIADEKYSLYQIKKIIKNKFEKSIYGTFIRLTNEECKFFDIKTYASHYRIKINILINIINDKFKINNNIPNTYFWSYNDKPIQINITEFNNIK